MKRALLIIVGMLVLLSLTKPVVAIGIGPPRYDLTFEPNLDTQLDYIVVNNIAGAVDVDLYVKGDLSQYISLDKTSGTLGPNGKMDFIASIKLPASIDVPGNHDIRIGAIASPHESGGGTVGAKAGVESILGIFVPYQGKFLSASLEASDAEVGQPVNLTLHLSNKGLEDINDISVKMDIYSEDRIADSWEFSDSNLLSGQEHVLSQSWPTDNMTAGKYRAAATISYGTDSKEAEASFNVGKPLIEIITVDVSRFSKGDIAKITVKAKSYWNKPIDDIFASVDILDSQKNAIKTVESNHKNIDALSNSSLDLFWDTKDVSEGDYGAKATLHYMGKASEKEFKISVKEGSSIMLWGSISAVAVILLAFIAYYSSSKRRKRKK